MRHEENYSEKHYGGEQVMRLEGELEELMKERRSILTLCDELEK
jgi:hypothetical protein